MPAEAALNWQAENAVAQNQILTQIASSQNRIEARMSGLDAIVRELKEKIQELHLELLHVASTVQDYSVANQFITQKEKEKRNLKAQLRDLEKQQALAQTTPVQQQPLF